MRKGIVAMVALSCGLASSLSFAGDVVVGFFSTSPMQSSGMVSLTLTNVYTGDNFNNCSASLNQGAIASLSTTANKNGLYGGAQTLSGIHVNQCTQASQVSAADSSASMTGVNGMPINVNFQSNISIPKISHAANGYTFEIDFFYDAKGQSMAACAKQSGSYANTCTSTNNGQLSYSYGSYAN